MYPFGSSLIITGLRAKPEYNGRAARVTSLPSDATGGRYAVELAAGAGEADAPKARFGPEAAFAEAFLTPADLEELRYEVVRPAMGDLQRVPADKASPGRYEAVGLTPPGPGLVVPTWPDEDDAFARCRPERRGRMCVLVTAAEALPSMPARGRHVLRGYFIYQWALSSAEDARSYFEQHVLTKRLEDIDLTGRRVALDGVHVDGADQSAVQVCCVSAERMQTTGIIDPSDHIWPDVCFNAVLRAGRFCAKLFLRVIGKPRELAGLQAKGLAAAAALAARMRTAQQLDTDRAANPLQLRVLPANLRPPGEPLEVVRAAVRTGRAANLQTLRVLPANQRAADTAPNVLAFGDVEDVGCAGCGRTDGLMRCSACRVVSYCGPDCQRADWPTHQLVCAQRGRRAPQRTPMPAGAVFAPLPTEPADFRAKWELTFEQPGAQPSVAAQEELYAEAERRGLELWQALVGSRLAIKVGLEQPERSVQLHLAAARTYFKHGDKYREGNGYADASIIMKMLPGREAQAEQYERRGLDMMLNACAVISR